MLVLKIALGVMLGLLGSAVIATLFGIAATRGGLVALLLLVALVAGAAAAIGLASSHRTHA